MKRGTILTCAMLGAASAGLVLTPLAAQEAGDVEAQGLAHPDPQTKGEARLAKLLQGREAGAPVRCISALPSQRMQTIEGTAYVYGSGRTIYVQRTRNPGQIDQDDALVTTRFNGSQICRLDQMTTVDRVLGVFTGAVFFEDFVPYTRVKPADAG